MNEPAVWLLTRRGFLTTTVAANVFNGDHVLAADPLPLLRSSLDKRDTPKEFQSLANRADVLLMQLSSGLSYFGKPRNYVTRYSFEDFSASVNTQMLALGKIEATQEKYANQSALTLGKLSAFQDAILHSKALQVQQSQELSSIHPDTLVELQKILDQLQGQIESAQIDLLSHEATFNDAVVAATNKCTFLEVATIIIAIIGMYVGVTEIVAAVAASSAVAGVAATAGAAASSSAAAGATGVAVSAGAAASTASDQQKKAAQANATVTELKTATGAYKEIGDAYKTIKDQLSTHPDSVRLVMSNDDLIKLKSDLFGKIDAAPVGEAIKREFEASASRYFDVIQARNEKLFERDRYLIQLISLQAELVDRENEQAQLQEAMTREQNPVLADYSEILDGMTMSLTRRVRDLVWQETGAYELWTLTKVMPGEFPIIGQTAADLQATHGSLKAAFDNYLLTHDDGQPFDPKLSVSIPLTTNQAELFAKTGWLAFDTDIANFDVDWARVFVTSIDVIVRDINEFSGKVIQLGRNVFRSTDRRITQFQTSPLVRAIQSGHTNAISIANEQGRYLGISPFSSWILVANQSVDRQALSKARSIELQFAGTFVTLA